MGFLYLRPALCDWADRQRGGGGGWREIEGKKKTTCRALRREMSGVVEKAGRESKWLGDPSINPSIVHSPTANDNGAIYYILYTPRTKLPT